MEQVLQVILTHENADFDAIASLLGAHKIYPGAAPVLPHRINRNVDSFLALYRTELPFVDPEQLQRGQHIRRVILVDTQSLTSVRGMSKALDEVLVIDHHTPPEDLPPNWVFRGELLGATSTLLVEALSARLIPVNRIEATLLLAGIYEDTGSLTYSATTARDMRAAAWLVDHEASLEIVNDFLHHPLSETQRELYDELLEHTESHQIEGHNVVVAWAEASSGMDEEISTLAHKLRDLLEPSALFILVGLGDSTQLVARSTTDDINVAEVARHFGGDGHDRAAAALMRDREVREVVSELREILPRFVRPYLTVRELMSYSVRTVRPETRIKEVAKQMLRTGHEGFPVVDEEGRVVGLVTRNAVDRALQHRWDHEPVRRIMEPGEVVVSPGDSAERVRTLMIQRGWGQIPVVEGDRVAGVVTRTDLIRLPTSEREQQRQQIAMLMDQAFPIILLALIRRIGEMAVDRGDHLYFVGGIVRDLLLGEPIFDVDLVVEGDAISLSRHLAHTYGGEVRTHNRFGTAKWLLSPEVWRDIDPTLSDEEVAELPNFIDFVTARTEFYTQPTALPTVAWSSIKQDLHRRDFTINTLAIRLNPGHWGEMLDFFGGKDDLEEGVLRVLHSLSFVEDPTRILRAARFEARLGFHLDPRSEDLIADALPLLDRVTGSRIRHELELIFHEHRPEVALDRLQEMGALHEIDPALVSDEDTHRCFARMREELDAELWKLDEDDLVYLHWSLFLHRLDVPALQRIAKRLMMPSRLTEALLRLPALHQILEDLPQVARPGDVVALLEDLPSPLLAAAWIIARAPEAREKVYRYWIEWRHVQPRLTGHDLKALGLEPGPIFREILESLREARLNGTIQSREEEIELAREMAARAGKATDSA
ncbi:MAG: CBS domain-containing protein [Anaerolineae bacterium]